MDREAWLAERRKMVGSSDSGAIVGVSPFSNALGVYLDKVGQMPDRKPSPLMAWGLRLEPAIAAAYQEEVGLTVEPPAEAIWRHEEHPWMGASIDRVRSDGRVVELKTANRFKGHEWGQSGTDEIPEVYLVQVQHQLAVAEGDVADVAVLIDGSDFRIYTVGRNDRLIAMLIEREAAFWEMVQKRRPPEPDWGHAATPALLEAMYQPDGSAVSLGQDAAEYAATYQRARLAGHAADKEQEVAKAHLLALMGHASRAALPGGRSIVRKKVSRKGYTVEPSEYVDFRIKEPKENPA
jgi:putative phage-type endonuclease